MSILKKLLVATAGASFVTLGATATVQAVTLTSDADSYIRANLADSNFGLDSELLVKNDTIGSGTFDRKAYVRFDLSSITLPSLTSATFSLTGRPGPGTINNVGAISTFNVYGLTNANQTWGETSITWNNAPANDNTGAGVTTGNPLVASFQVTGTGVGTTNLISDPRLLTFLNTRINAPDNNNLATFIVTRPSTSSTIGDYVHAFNSKEAFVGNPSSEPTLEVTAAAVPFEFSPGLGILVLGAWGAVAQLKSKVKNSKSLPV